MQINCFKYFMQNNGGHFVEFHNNLFGSICIDSLNIKKEKIISFLERKNYLFQLS